MIPKILNSITKTDIESLVANQVHEGRTIEYKQILPGNGDEDKREFMADVCSFANAVGGDILYGVQENDGIPVVIPGLADFNEDKERLRLDNMIRDGITPRIQGVQMLAVPGFGKGPLFVLRIPRSWNGPHMVTFRGNSRFYGRGSAGKYQMDISEIRSAFQGAELLSEKIRQWRDGRIGRLVASDTPVPLAYPRGAVVHIIPLESFMDEWRINANNLDDISIWKKFTPPGVSSLNHRLNLDGLVVSEINRENGPASLAYVQLFRSGRLELVDTTVVPEGKEVPRLSWGYFEKQIVETLPRYLQAMRLLGIQSPCVVMMALANVKGVKVILPPRWTDSSNAIDRDIVLLPDVLIENVDGEILAECFHPLFDAVWNACGIAGSPNYETSGKWKPLC